MKIVSLTVAQSAPPAVEATENSPVGLAAGACEVVVYSPHHNSSLPAEPVEQIYKLVRVWTDRCAKLAKREEVKYVYIFENKVEATGVTLHHPHVQIYAYPFIPPKVEIQLEQARKDLGLTGRNLFDDIIVAERSDDGASRRETNR